MAITSVVTAIVEETLVLAASFMLSPAVPSDYRQHNLSNLSLTLEGSKCAYRSVCSNVGDLRHS